MSTADPSELERFEVDDDPIAFSQLAYEHGWTEGLPAIPPTEARVAAYVEAARLPGETVLGELPPNNRDCTVELLAVNAVLAGARADAMPLLCAQVRLLGEMGLFGAVTTTNAAAPVFMVNGTARERFGIPYQEGCMGGAASRATAIGRTLRLVMRNVGGEVAGVSSKIVFGQPARQTGLVFGEWEEQSPWEPLSVRYGFGAEAISCFVTTGTEDIVDISATDGDSLAQMIAESFAYPAQAIVISIVGGDIFVVVCPPWAWILGKTFATATALSERLWEQAVIERDRFPASHQDALDERGLFDTKGRVLVSPSPANVHVAVAGGLGGLHATGFRAFASESLEIRALDLPA